MMMKTRDQTRIRLLNNIHEMNGEIHGNKLQNG